MPTRHHQEIRVEIPSLDLLAIGMISQAGQAIQTVGPEAPNPARHTLQLAMLDKAQMHTLVPPWESRICRIIKLNMWSRTKWLVKASRRHQPTRHPYRSTTSINGGRSSGRHEPPGNDTSGIASSLPVRKPTTQLRLLSLPRRYRCLRTPWRFASTTVVCTIEYPSAW